MGVVKEPVPDPFFSTAQEIIIPSLQGRVTTLLQGKIITKYSCL